MSEFEPVEYGTREVAERREMNETLENWHDCDQQAHVVQFYESDAFLADEVARFIGMALGAGDAAIVIATKAHREQIERNLETRGLNMARAIGQGRYVALDAAETLAKFMVGDMPDAERFRDAIGAVLSRATEAACNKPARVAAFGEMVALLWAERKESAVIRLEQLWNGLAETHSFSLRCAYPMNGFSRRDDSEPFLKICAEHSSVVPAESYVALVAEGEKRRAIAHLQQQARALEAEKALQRSEERFRRLVEGVQDYAIYSMDPNGIITSWNAGARRIKGYTADEIIGQNFSRFYTPEDLKRSLPAKVLQTAREEGHYDGEGWRVRKDGSRFWSNVVVTPLRNERGTLIGFSKITRDMTERRALLERIQLHAAELEQTQQTLRRLSGQLLRVQDEERRRLARELHDGAGQILAALNMNLETLAEATKNQLSSNLSGRLTESISLANQVIRETRTLSYLLHPPLLDEAGLTDALHWFVGGFIDRSGIQTALEMAADFPRLPRDLETAIFRIIQEALTNIHRHSGSRTASIQLTVAGEEILLTVSDQGKGINSGPEPAEQNGNGHNGNGRKRKLGVGIAGMRERVLQMGGRFDIGAANPGTLLKAVFPCQPEID
jgi:PAS domain S-box-containing protein